MACASAELTGVPGVVVVGNGPGLASVVNGVAHAWLDRVPLLVISDRYTEAEAATTGHQILDQRALLAPVVKWSATVDASAGPTVDHALAVALAAPCGPVHLDMPRTVGAETARARVRRQTVPERHDLSRTPSLDDVVAALADAARPVIVAGLEAARTLSAGDLAALAERLGAPVLTTYKAKGVLDEAHPLWAGIVTGGAIEAPLLERRRRDPRGRARPGRAADQAVAVGGADRAAPVRRAGARRAASQRARPRRRRVPRGRARRAAHRLRQRADRVADRRDPRRGAARTTRSRPSTPARTCSPRPGSGARTRRGGS